MLKITEYFNIDQFRAMIASLLSVPANRVLKWGVQQDVSALDFFCTVRVNPSAQLATHREFKKTEEVEGIKAQKETTVIVGFHGKNALIMAEFFQSTLISEQANRLFDSIKTGLVRTSDVQNLTIPFGGGYEERAEIQLVLSHNFNIEYKQNRIESVNIGLVLNQ
jgi:hypothetical protein